MHSTPDPYRAARLLLDAYPSLLGPAAARPADSWRPLSACELRVHSQNGEDGVLAEMLSRIGPGTRSFVEFGVGAGSEGNCVFLADWCGWRGLFMESQPEAFARLGRKYGMNPDVQTFQTIVAPGTIDALLHRAGIPYDLDVLSIDVDGADYWIWSALTRAAPRVVVIEYNAALGGERRLAQHPARQTWDGTVAFGASIAALASLGRARGYSLTHTDLTGTNAFFVRDDYAALFPEIKAPRIRGPNLSLRSEGHRPSERQAVFVEVPEQRAHEEPTADGDTGVQRVVATGLGPLLFPATDRVIAACIRDTGVWQPAELDWLKTHVPRGGTCLTIGANVGYFACWMSRLVGPRGRVLAVEPNPRLVPLLRANLAECALPNVDVAPCAAGAADGTATLWISDANSGDSRVFDPRLVETDDDHDANGCGDWLHSVDVPMRAADGIVGDRAVDVVFIDAQGWDHHVLRGLRSTIDRCRPVILFEFVPAWIRSLGEDPAMVLAECASWGYRLGSSDVAVEHPAAPDVMLAAMAAAGQAFVNIEMLPGDPVPTSGRGA
jgi:FkbM family methyltransferase